jgi:MFS family permease
VADQWFVTSRGLVVGILTAGSATGQLAFLPFIALLVEGSGWRQASLLVAGGALVVVPLVLLFLRNRPARVKEVGEYIRALIKQLVAAENPKKPLSDSQLTDILGDQGIVVARRTVAKYRESLQIPAASQRKTL